MNSRYTVRQILTVAAFLFLFGGFGLHQLSFFSGDLIRDNAVRTLWLLPLSWIFVLAALFYVVKDSLRKDQG